MLLSWLVGHALPYIEDWTPTAFIDSQLLSRISKRGPNFGPRRHGMTPCHLPEWVYYSSRRHAWLHSPALFSSHLSP